MKEKTADIQHANMKLKRQNEELLLDVSSKTEEIARLKKKFNEKCNLVVKNENIVNDLISNKIQLQNENHKHLGKLQQEELKYQVAINQRDEAFQLVCKLHNIIDGAKLELDAIEIKLMMEARQYLKSFQSNSDQPHNIAQRVEETIESFNKLKEELLMKQL